MQVNLSLSPGYRLKISRASRMSELADHVITAIAAIGGSTARTSARSSSSSTCGYWKKGHALRQEAYQREREALQALAEERERRHKAELQ